MGERLWLCLKWRRGLTTRQQEVKHEPCTAVAKNILPSRLVRQGVAAQCITTDMLRTLRHRHRVTFFAFLL